MSVFPLPQQVATGQVWVHTRTGRRVRILLAADDIVDDWKHETIPAGDDKRRTGRIFGFALRRSYTLESEPTS